jgi:hypothetical protein
VQTAISGNSPIPACKDMHIIEKQQIVGTLQGLQTREILAI